MDSRQRILLALDGGEPDRIPVALSFYHVDIDNLLPTGVFQDEWIDVQFVSFPLSPEERQLSRTAQPYRGDTRLGTITQVTTYDHWGYHPDRIDQRNPLAYAQTLDDIRKFPFPDISSPYQANGLHGQVKLVRERGWAVGGNLPHLGGELFEAAWRLRGLENFLVDLVRRPAMAHYLLDRLAELAERNAETLARAGVDILSLDDDVGMPGTMFISPTLWREFFKPRMARIIRAARQVSPELRLVYHSDGYFEPIIEDLIEIGVNAINPLQPDHMDAHRIRQKFGTRLALWGTVGWQTTFSYANPDQIRSEVRQRTETLGKAGLILCPAYDIDEPDIPWENVRAFLEASHSIR